MASTLGIRSRAIAALKYSSAQPSMHTTAIGFGGRRYDRSPVVKLPVRGE